MSIHGVLQQDDLNESWFDVVQPDSSGDSMVNVQTSGLYTPLNIEKLLKDAQRESGQNSRDASARTSPKGLHSPTGLPPQEVADWMWDWSSGPEKIPSREQAFRLQNASRQRNKYTTIRNTPIMKGSLYCKENLVPLLISHVSVFALGVLVTFFIMRRSSSSCQS